MGTGHGIQESACGQKDVGGYLMDYHNRQRPHTFNDGILPFAAEETPKYCAGLVDHYNNDRPWA